MNPKSKKFKALKGDREILNSNRPLISNNFPQSYYEASYEDDLIQYEGDLISAVNRLDYVDAVLINESYAIITYKKGMLDEVLATVPEIVYVAIARLYTPQAINPLDDAQISQFHTNTLLNLTGRGTVIAIIDSGIDYLNKEFQYEDNTSKVLRIWDQTIRNGKEPKDYGYGTEYTREDINSAIALGNSGGDPYSIVKSRDTTGHGTGVAGIASARGRNIELTGAAPDAELVIVKVKEAREAIKVEEYGNIPVSVPVYREIDVIMGIKYAYEYSVENNKPLVILLPVGTNKGAHSSYGFTENYLASLSIRRGVAIITGTGNEGDSATHTSGIIQKAGDTATFEVNLEAAQKNLVMMAWLSKPDKAKISIVSPSGEFVDKLSPKFDVPRPVTFITEGTTIDVQYYLPEEISGDEAIIIKITNIASGVWTFNLIGETIINGRYDVWLPQHDLLTEGTRFIAPTQETTLTIPSNTDQVITVGYYNQNNNTNVAASGRGYNRSGEVKPDITTGGIDVLTVGLNNSTQIMSGSSVATAVVAGAVALILQWGIVDGKDPTMFNAKIKAYLIGGTRKIQGEIYPNPTQGYGILDLQSTFFAIRDIDTLERSVNNEEEFYKGKKIKVIKAENLYK